MNVGILGRVLWIVSMGSRCFVEVKMDVLSVQVVSDYRELVGLVGPGSCGVVLHRRGRSQSELYGQLRVSLRQTLAYPLVDSLSILKVELGKEMPITDLTRFPLPRVRNLVKRRLEVAMSSASRESELEPLLTYWHG